MGVGAQHCPPGLYALWGPRAVGVVGGRHRGGWPATVVRGVWCQALSLPQPPVLWGGQPGFRDPCVPGAVGAGVGTQHQPHGARPCGPALRAVGVAEGRPRGRAVRRCEGRLGSAAPPPPAARPLGGLLWPTTHWLWVRGGAGVGSRHQPHSARSCVLWGRHQDARGVASCLDVGRPGSGALPPPTARPLGGLPGPTTQWLWVRGAAGVETRHQPHSTRSRVLWGRQEGARGGLLLPGCRVSGVGRSPTPDCPPSGRAAGADYALAVGAGGGGRRDP